MRLGVLIRECVSLLSLMGSVNRTYFYTDTWDERFADGMNILYIQLSMETKIAENRNFPRGKTKTGLYLLEFT